MKNGINFIRNERCEFNVWAPFLSKVAVKIISPEEKVIPMEKDTEGYWKTTIAGITPAAKYFIFSVMKRIEQTRLHITSLKEFMEHHKLLTIVHFSGQMEIGGGFH